ncbi:MAG: CoB--CoM heterodisulfide reductase iron-sulfur subunit B family protein [Candidatus Saelkia tenebricola]|nr:CoB--CoM heterodisulfide reductase iron-sulfur subunit B family protein [Candidatus Saelkia tenebricola]
MNKYALFLGCTTPTKVPQYELASRWVCKYFGIELIDIKDFICCGINQVNLSIEAGLLMASMNLALAEAKELDILTLCAACTGALAEAIERLKDDTTKNRVNEKLGEFGLEYKGRTKVKHISRVLYEDVGIERIKEEVKKDLSGFCVAPHYGCHYLKPKSAFEGFEEPDNPRSLHQLISAIGAQPVNYEALDLCCGGKVFPVSEDLADSLVQKKLDSLKNKRIDAMVLQCQTCYLMYSDRQKEINKKSGKQYNLPIILYPQLLGVALGADPVKNLGFNLHTVSVDKVLEKIA